MPQLWHSLDAVQDLQALGSLSLEQIKFYTRWISRSGNLPLSLGVSFSAEQLLLSDVWLQAVLCYRDRFEWLRVVDEVGLDFNLVLDGTHLLAHLVIEAWSQEGELAIVQPQPCLHTLILDLIHASPPTFISAEWASLTHLTVRLPDNVSYEADEFLRLLEHCPNLERLVTGPVAVRSLRQASLSHPTLRELSMIFDGSEALEDPVSVLRLPGLHLLKVLYRLEGDLEGVLVSDKDPGPFALDGPADSSNQEPPSNAGLPRRMCRIQVQGGNKCFAMFDLCWANITHLDVEVAGSTGVLGMVLTLCPNLQALSLYGRHCTASCTSLSTPFIHPKLSFLSITVWAEIGNFFLEATLPGLQDLGILAISYGQPEDVHAFFVCSGCPLKVLTMRAKGSRVWTAEEQAELKELIPTLAQLELNI